MLTPAGGLGYFDDPHPRHHADRLAADAVLVGAYPFTAVLGGLA